MKVLYSPKIDESRKLDYEFTETTINIKFTDAEGKVHTDFIDFSEVPDGVLDIVNTKTDVPTNVLWGASKEGNNISVELTKFIPKDAYKEELFPALLDHKERTELDKELEERHKLEDSDGG